MLKSVTRKKALFRGFETKQQQYSYKHLHQQQEAFIYHRFIIINRRACGPYGHLVITVFSAL